MKYKVELTETLKRIVEVEADNASDALIKVGLQYSCGEIVLDSSDFVGYEIKEHKEE